MEVSASRLIDAPMQMLRTLPVLALIPFFIIWFGIGEVPKVALVAVAAVFPIYLTLYSGIRGVDPKLVELAKIIGLSRGALIRHVILPGALPTALVGVRYSLGISWLILVAAEQVNVDLAIGSGEFVALLGRSGSRNSTLLRTLAGLDAPTAGSVQVPTERMVVFQEPRLLPWKTAAQNVALGLKGSDAKERARAALAEVGLDVPVT
jgi:ABC-type nitrate/sulfonate/bicarbonate transport system permease component